MVDDFSMIDDFLNADSVQPIIDRHGLESVKEQYYLMRLFHQQYNPATDGDFTLYLAERLKQYQEIG